MIGVYSVLGELVFDPQPVVVGLDDEGAVIGSGDFQSAVWLQALHVGHGVVASDGLDHHSRI